MMCVAAGGWVSNSSTVWVAVQGTLLIMRSLIAMYKM